MAVYFAFYAMLAILAGGILLIGSNTRIAIQFGAGIAAILIFIIFAGFRHETGFDWLAYESVYFGDGGLVIEPGYAAILHAMRAVRIPFWVSQLAVTGISAYSLFLISRYFKISVALPIFLYSAWLYLDLQMGVARTTIALSLVLLGMLVNSGGRKKFGGYFLFLLAILFHVASIFYLLAFFFKRWWRVIARSRVRLAVLYVLMLPMGILISPLVRYLQNFLGATQYFESRSQIYITNDFSMTWNAQTLLKIFLMVITSFAIREYFSKLREVDKENSVLGTLCVAVVAYPAVVFLFPSVYVAHDRFFYFAMTAMSVLIPVLIKLSPSNPMRLLFVACAACGIYVSSLTLRSFNSTVFIPYQSQFSRALGDEGDGRQRTQWYYRQRTQ